MPLTNFCHLGYDHAGSCNLADGSVGVVVGYGVSSRFAHGLVDAFQATCGRPGCGSFCMVDAANPHFPEQPSRYKRCWLEIDAVDIPQWWCSTSSMRSPEQRPLQLRDSHEMDGRPVPRVFLSAYRETSAAQQLTATVIAGAGPGHDPGIAPEITGGSWSD